MDRKKMFKNIKTKIFYLKNDIERLEKCLEGKDQNGNQGINRKDKEILLH